MERSKRQVKNTKRRNWYAVRLDYTQDEDGWSECGAWHLAHIADPDVVIKGTGMQSLVDRMLSSKPAHWVMVNLDIDGRMLIGYLLHKGWHAIDIGSPKEKEFRPLISEDGKIIRIRIRCSRGLQDVQDLRRLVPVSLATLRGMVTDGVRDWRISDDVCVAARMLSQLNGDDLTRITISSNAYNDLLDMMGRRRFRQLFPKLTSEENKAAADALTGGFVYLKEGYSGKRIGRGLSVDANSLYPSVARVNRLPEGKPHRFEGAPPDDHLLKIYTALVDWDIKEDGLPVLARRWRKYEENEGHSAAPVEVTMTDVDWALFEENYDLEILEYRGGYKFYSRVGTLNSYFDKWGDVKMHSTGGRRLLSKFMINVIIGYFGSRTTRVSRVPILGEDGRVSYELQDPTTTSGIYAPLTAFVNAYGRRELVAAIKANQDRVVYCDTDSMHLIGDEPPKGITIDEGQFGTWKIEKRFSEAVHLREKSYLWTDAETGKLECKVSGMPENIAAAMDYSKFKPGWQNWDRKTGRVEPGLERWLPMVDGERMRLFAGRYRISA